MSAAAAVIRVGRKAVTPCGGSARAERAHLLDVGGHQVDPGEAVDLEVDQARSGDPAARRRRQPDLDDLVAVDADVAGQQVAVDEGGRDPQRLVIVASS